MNIRISGIASRVAHSSVHIPSLPATHDVLLTGCTAMKKPPFIFVTTFQMEHFLYYTVIYTADVGSLLFHKVLNIIYSY